MKGEMHIEKNNTQFYPGRLKNSVHKTKIIN